jgi:enoyl-CoA hydratase/carnithine racemase
MPSLATQQQQGVAIFTLRGDNDLNLGVVNADLYQALVSYRDDQTLRCAIVTGAGSRAFSAGADMKARTQDGRPMRNPWTVQTLELVTDPAFDKPLIAAVNGHAIGQGLILALACDIRVASEHATFALPEVKHGMAVAPQVVHRVRELMPFGPALELLLTGDRVSAQQALTWGLVNHVTPPDELLALALGIAERIAANPVATVQAVRRMALEPGMPSPDPLQ